MTDAGRSWARWARRELQAFAPLFALSGFALAQPVLDVLGRNPELVAFRGAGAVELWVVGLVVVGALPLVLWLTELAVGALQPPARPFLHLAFVALLAAALGAQVLHRVVGLDGPVLLVGVALAGAGLAAAARWSLVRLWLSYAAWAPLAFLVLFAGFSPAAAGARVTGSTIGGVVVHDPARVVMLVLDELPLASLLDAEGGIDGDLYPGFAELAGSANWFREASGVGTATTHAVPGLLTGRLPRPDTSPLVSDHPENLFTLLGGAYDLEVAESLTRLCPAALCDTSGTVETSAVRSLLGDGSRIWQEQVSLRAASDPLATFREPGGEPHGGGWQDVGLEQPERFSDLLRSFDGTPRRTLHYAHLLLPHTPSRYLPSGRHYPQPAARFGPLWEEPGRFFDLWTEDEWPVLLGRQRAILQTQYVDRLVQTLIAELRDAGLWDDTLVVVTADHGRAFQPGLSARGIDPGTDPAPVLPEVIGVPLFVKEPGQRAGVVQDGNVQLTDLLPTIADILGIDLPWEVDGTSALAPGTRPATKTVVQQLLDADLSARVGPTLEIPAEGFFARVVERGVHTLVAPDGALRAHRIGPGAELVGREVTAAMTGPASGATAELHDPGALDAVDPPSGSVPVFVTGELDGGGAGDVAVVVNGRVGGVSSRFDWDGHTDVFAVMLPEELLEPGRNVIELYLVDDPEAPRLRPVRLTR